MDDDRKDASSDCNELWLSDVVDFVGFVACLKSGLFPLFKKLKRPKRLGTVEAVVITDCVVAEVLAIPKLVVVFQGTMVIPFVDK